MRPKRDVRLRVWNRERVDMRNRTGRKGFIWAVLDLTWREWRGSDMVDFCSGCECSEE